MKHFEDTHKEHHHDSALNVAVGVVKPESTNPHYQRKKLKTLTTDDYVKGILDGNIAILGKAITLVESVLPEHYEQAQEIIEKCLPFTGNSIRVGITGVPGAGKSTFIEAIGNKVIALGNKLAVLAIDPSSERSKGSILGDKTRMETLVHNPDAFIRPSPSAGSLGGVARKTRETIILCEAAGFNTIFIETVGVGQSETMAHSMVDVFLMLQISGAGDELQGIKRGIMEMADVVAITKADGDNVKRADLTRRHFINALSLFPMPKSGYMPQVFTCSSLDGTGLMDIWRAITDYVNAIKSNGFFIENRNEQEKYRMYDTINNALKERFYNNKEVAENLEKYLNLIHENKISAYIAAKELLQIKS